jgi:hypothetical protein
MHDGEWRRASGSQGWSATRITQLVAQTLDFSAPLIEVGLELGSQGSHGDERGG